MCTGVRTQEVASSVVKVMSQHFSTGSSVYYLTSTNSLMDLTIGSSLGTDVATGSVSDDGGGLNLCSTVGTGGSCYVCGGHGHSLLVHCERSLYFTDTHQARTMCSGQIDGCWRC